MKTMKFVLASVSLLFLYDAAYACRCQPTKPSSDTSRYAAVFSGKVVEAGFKQLPDGAWQYTITFEVGRVWKGEAKKRITLINRLTSCDFHFRKGESWLIFASTLSGGSRLTTSQCSRTGLVSKREADMGLLGEGKVPAEGKT
jgi:hypothetical protein